MTSGYLQWLNGVRRRAAVRWTRGVDEALDGASGRRFAGIAAVVVTAVMLSAAIGIAVALAG